jgi:hypothetical protein
MVLFNLCEDRGKFVYEVVPIFGDKLTLEELEYWIAFGIIQKAKFNDIEYKALPLDVVIELNKNAEKKRRAIK